MPIHFAAARSTAHSPIARALAKKAFARAANDNGMPGGEGLREHDELVKAALRHFGEHGFDAAKTAQTRAHEALAEGDDQGFDWWLGVCRTLDRKIAADLVAQASAASLTA